MTNLPRRSFLHVVAAAAALPVLRGSAWAQSYPARPVHIVVGFAPGGANDIHARLIGAWLADKLGQPFVVDNRPGAAGNLATESVVRAPPDGYTLLLVSTSNAVNAAVYDNPNLNIDVVRDIAPVASLMRNGQVLVVTPSFPARTVGELVAYAKANPGKINMASSGNGGAAHLSGELFKMMTGIDVIHVPYRGEAPAITDVIGGQVQMIFATTTASIEYIRTGKLHALGVTSTQRSAALPDVPTVAESVPGFEVTSWAGIAAPKNTPAEIVDTLNAAVNQALASDGIKARYAEMATTLAPGSPAEFAKFIAGEAAKWAKVVKFAGIKPQ